MFMPRRKLSLLVALPLFGLLPVSSLQAQATLHYFPGGSPPAAWSTSVAAWTSTAGTPPAGVWVNGVDHAVFSQSGVLLPVVVSGTISAASITFSVNGYSLTQTGGSNSLTAGTVTTNATATNAVPFGLAAGGTTFAGTGSLTMSGVISDGAGDALTKSGTGSLFLTGANTYSGITYILGGTLFVGADAPVGSAGAFGNGSSAVRLGDTSGSGDASLIVPSGNRTVSRAILVQAGNGGVMTIGSTQSSGTVTFNGTITLGKDLTLFQASGGSLVIAGSVVRELEGSAAGLAKWGAGTATLSGSASVSVKTVNIVEGTLAFGRSASSTVEQVFVGSGATLSAGQATPFSGTTTALTLTGGTVRFATNVTQQFGNFTNTGSSVIDFNDFDSSTLTFSGTPSIAGGVTVLNYNYTADPSSSGPQLRIAGLDETARSKFTINGVTGATYYASTDILVAVPEPSTYAAAAGVLALGVAAYRRRRAKQGTMQQKA